jgi:hypothetical protein
LVLYRRLILVLAKILGDIWGNMSEAEKQPYRDEANKLADEHKVALSTWREL